MRDMEYLRPFYNPSREEALMDYKHLHDKLMSCPYDDLESFDDDFMFAVKTYFYCIYENFDTEQTNKLYKSFIELFIRRKAFMD